MCGKKRTFLSAKKLTYQVQSSGRRHREAAGKTQPGCQGDERNLCSNRRSGPWWSLDWSHKHTHKQTCQNHETHTSTGGWTRVTHTQCGVYLSNMSLVSFNSLMVKVSCSVSPHAWQRTDRGCINTLLCEYFCVSPCLCVCVCVCVCVCSDLISECVLVVSQHVPGQRPLRAGLHLCSDPAQLLLHLQQRQTLLQRHAATNREFYLTSFNTDLSLHFTYWWKIKSKTFLFQASMCDKLVYFSVLSYCKLIIWLF